MVRLDSKANRFVLGIEDIALASGLSDKPFNEPIHHQIAHIAGFGGVDQHRVDAAQRHLVDGIHLQHDKPTSGTPEIQA